MVTGKLSKELSSLFTYMKETICVEKPNCVINEYAFILSVMRNEESLAYQSLSSLIMESTLNNMKEFYNTHISYNSDENENNKSPYSLFDSYITDCVNICKEYNVSEITSSILLMSIITNHEEISKEFRDFSVTLSQFSNSVSKQLAENTKELVYLPKKHVKKKRKAEVIKIMNGSNNGNNIEDYDNNVDRYLLNLTKLAMFGDIPSVINYEKYYEKIFTIFAKKERNNVAICGKHGVGKTAIVKNLANIINSKHCHKKFHNKILVELDFSKLVIGTQFKGAFEQKFYSILNDAKTNGNYIFFIDDLGNVLNGNSKYAETDIETILQSLLAEPSILTICTMQQKEYSNLHKNYPSLERYLQDIVIEEPNDKEVYEILDKTKQQYEIYHNVKYTEDALKECIKLCKRYFTNNAMPYSTLDLMDMVGAKAMMNVKEDKEITELNKELKKIIEEIEAIKTTSENKEYDKIDELTKKQIEIKSKISIKEKELFLNKEPYVITKEYICSVVSEKLDLPLESVTKSEKDKLKGINDKLKESVIGQDEAIDEVCRVVKRQRVGLGDKNRPSVLMFLGSTGVGKTYLAKQLAKEVFGDDKYFVRMDMSEYADKTSVAKICGSSHGYVGFEDETYLVSALKKKKRFVLLLDEFEKSNEEVHNVFLQMFDEGRFTDNHGNVYSLRDVIIILTSNVGVAEAVNRGKAIGFNDSNYDMSKEIIEKELKRKFKPEFLNRIQKIVYFNKLNDESLLSIIKIEVNKIEKKLNNLNYYLSEDITKTIMIDELFNVIKEKKDYGARPIVNEVQRRIEDKIVDLLIENEIEEGHVFTYNELIK